MKKIISVILFLLLLFPVIGQAQEDSDLSPIVFTARVLEVLEEKIITRDDGSQFVQQNLKLIGLNGQFQDQHFNYLGVGDLEVIGGNVYQKGDKVKVMYQEDLQGQGVFYVTDFVRQSYLIWLTVFLLLVVVVVASWKGLKALFSLALTFVIILWFIIPLILRGYNPLFITILGSLFILMIIVYLTEGFNRKSTVSVLSIGLSLLITGVLAIVFTSLARLTGSAQEEVMYLIGAGKGVINFQGLLLAGIIIGTLGALDDGAISQVAAVDELKKANPNLHGWELYRRAMKIGTSHIGSMINTLFLAYAGASMPLLLIFSLRQEPFNGFDLIINNETIATEIVRAFVGSIGLALAIPIATILAVYLLKNKNT